MAAFSVVPLLGSPGVVAALRTLTCIGLVLAVVLVRRASSAIGTDERRPEPAGLHEGEGSQRPSPRESEDSPTLA